MKQVALLIVVASIATSFGCKTPNNASTAKEARPLAGLHFDYGGKSALVYIERTAENAPIVNALAGINYYSDSMGLFSQAFNHAFISLPRDPKEELRITMEAKDGGGFQYPPGYTCLGSGVAPETLLGRKISGATDGDTLFRGLQASGVAQTPSIADPQHNNAYRITDNERFIELVPYRDSDAAPVVWQLFACGVNK